MNFRTIRIEGDARGVATVSLARPDKHNAMNPEMMAELTEAAVALGADPRVRAVVLAGEGESFCAGGDLGWMRAQFEASREQRIAAAMTLARTLSALNDLPKPLIGRIQGQTFGGGIGLLAVCDVAVAARGSKFGLTEVRLGIIPAVIGPFVMACMGEARARRVLISGRIFDADEARELDLVAHVVEPDALDAAVEAEIAPYLSASPVAVAAAKALVRSLAPAIDARVLEETAARLAAAWDTDDAREGAAAFFERRKPGFAL